MFDSSSCVKQHEYGPNYVGYYKHLVQEIYSQNEETKLDSETNALSLSEEEAELYKNQKAGKACSYRGCFSLFSEGICEGLSEFQKERLRSILNQSVPFLTQEADEILGQILAKCQIEADLRGEEILPSYSSSDEDMSFPRPLHKKREKSSSPITNYYGCQSDLNLDTFRKVCKDIQALQGNGEICHKAVDVYSNRLLEKLGKMEQDLEGYLNVVMSGGREMTRAEKQQLGRRIQKLPNKALDRVVEIVHLQNFPGIHVLDNIHVNLEEQDNVTLWRLYFYVEAVAKANKL